MTIDEQGWDSQMARPPWRCCLWKCFGKAAQMGGITSVWVPMCGLSCPRMPKSGETGHLNVLAMVGTKVLCPH